MLTRKVRLSNIQKTLKPQTENMIYPVCTLVMKDLLPRGRFFHSLQSPIHLYKNQWLLLYPCMQAWGAVN